MSKFPSKIAEIMKKKGFPASFILGGALSSVFNFLKSYFIICDVFETKDIWFLKITKYMNLILLLKRVKYTNED